VDNLPRNLEKASGGGDGDDGDGGGGDVVGHAFTL